MTIEEELRQKEDWLRSYEELEVDMMDDASYVARGNGFCDTKYSEDFIEGQKAKLRQRIAELKQMLQKGMDSESDKH